MGERSHFRQMETGQALDEVLLQKALWTEPSTQARVQQLTDAAATQVREQAKSILEGQIITGKERLEYNWNQLEEDWRLAYVAPLKKAFHVYIEHKAVAGVPLDQYVDPRYILPSRMVLTNKGGKKLAEALLKARWVFGGHKDPEAGEHLTAAPTVSLVGHNLLVFIAVQMSWTIIYEDVSAAFLQGQPLATEREIYVRLPTQYPPEVLEELYGMIGEGHRQDIVRLTKGGFGLPESPRLWYLEYRQTLKDLGGHELRLLPGFFCFYDEKGVLHGMACIHVDDTRYAGAPTAEPIWQELHRRLRFGDRRDGLGGWTKFCGRYERQDPVTKEVEYSVDEYCKDIPSVPARLPGDLERPLTPVERKNISSVIGQIDQLGCKTVSL